MLSATVITGTRLKPWKMKPMASRRSAVAAASSRASMAWPRSRTVPASARSIRPAMFRIVLLPLPDGPVSATSSPGRTARSTPRSAGTVCAPSW